MRLLVCGGRYFSNTELMYRTLDRIHRERIVTTVIEGGARGADRMAGYWSRKNKIFLKVYHANWDADPKGAGIKRNIRMLEDGRPDMVVAFAGGRGTAHMVGIARKAGVEVLCIDG